MRIVGDVYVKYDKAVSDAERTLLQAKAGGNTTAIAAADAALTAAKTAKAGIETERALAHGLVGALTAALGGANPTSGFIGGTTAKLVTTELDKLLADNAWAIKNPTAANLIKTLSATAAGSITGGTTGGFVASQGDRFNRQLHWSKYVAKKLACTAAASASTECASLNKMTGTRPQALAAGFAGLTESKVIANYDDQNRIVSYTIADLGGNPQLIMEPLEFEVYRSLPQNGRAQYLTSSQYELDSASYLLYYSAGETARAFEHLRYAYADPELWRNTAADVALGAALGKVAGVIAKSEYGKKIAWAIERAITKADLPPGYVLAQDGRVLKDGRYVSEKEAARAVNWKLGNGRDWFPPNDGFVGTPKETLLTSGTLDRLVKGSGPDTGSFAAPPGTSFGARALPGSAGDYTTNSYQILKPIPVLEGKTAAWFGQPGGGMQWKIDAAKLGDVRSVISDQTLKAIGIEPARAKWSMATLEAAGYIRRR